MTAVTSNSQNPDVLIDPNKQSFSEMVKLIDENATVKNKMWNMATAVPAGVAATALIGTVSYLLGSIAMADHIPAGMQAIAGVGAVAMTGLTIGALHDHIKPTGALIVSLGKDVKKALSSMLGFSKANPGVLSNKVERDLKNINSVLTMMDEKGKKSYLVGKEGQKARITDEKGMRKFVKSLGTSPYLAVESKGGELSVKPFSGDKAIGREVVIPEADFSSAVSKFTGTIEASRNREFANALDEVAPEGPKLG